MLCEGRFLNRSVRALPQYGKEFAQVAALVMVAVLRAILDFPNKIAFCLI